MPRGIKKEKLPSKVCVVCNRPFTWRKQWERVQWNEVTTCSKSCNNKRRQENRREKETDRGIHVHESWLCFLNEEEMYQETFQILKYKRKDGIQLNFVLKRGDTLIYSTLRALVFRVLPLLVDVSYVNYISKKNELTSLLFLQQATK